MTPGSATATPGSAKVFPGCAAGDPAQVVVPIMRSVYTAANDAEADRVRDGLQREMQRGRESRTPLPAAIARAAGAGVAERAVVGTRSEVTDRLARYRERLGMDLLIARPQVANTTQSEREAALERLASEVLPDLT